MLSLKMRIIALAILFHLAAGETKREFAEIQAGDAGGQQIRIGFKPTGYDYDNANCLPPNPDRFCPLAAHMNPVIFTNLQPTSKVNFIFKGDPDLRFRITVEKSPNMNSQINFGVNEGNSVTQKVDLHFIPTLFSEAECGQPGVTTPCYRRDNNGVVDFSGKYNGGTKEITFSNQNKKFTIKFVPAGSNVISISLSLFVSAFFVSRLF